MCFFSKYQINYCNIDISNAYLYWIFSVINAVYQYTTLFRVYPLFRDLWQVSDKHVIINSISFSQVYP